MSAEARTTTNHDEIKNWVEQRGGRPATVKTTGMRREPGILRINFPGFSGEDTLEDISWESFFEAFDRNNLAFLYQEELKSGEPSRFFKLVRREDEAVKSDKSRAVSEKN